MQDGDEVAAGEGAGRVADALRGADELDVHVPVESLAQVLEAVAPPGDEDPRPLAGGDGRRVQGCSWEAPFTGYR